MIPVFHVNKSCITFNQREPIRAVVCISGRMDPSWWWLHVDNALGTPLPCAEGSLCSYWWESGEGSLKTWCDEGLTHSSAVLSSGNFCIILVEAVFWSSCFSVCFCSLGHTRKGSVFLLVYVVVTVPSSLRLLLPHPIMSHFTHAACQPLQGPVGSASRPATPVSVLDSLWH